MSVASLGDQILGFGFKDRVMGALLAINHKLDLIWKKLNEQRRPRATKLVIGVSVKDGEYVTVRHKKGHKMAITLRDDFILPLVVSGADAKGFAAPVEGVTYSSSDETIATVDANGVVTPVAPGTAQVTVKADAEIGDGEVDLVGTVDVEVVAGQAVTLAVSGTPVAPTA